MLPAYVLGALCSAVELVQNGQNGLPMREHEKISKNKFA